MDNSNQENNNTTPPAPSTGTPPAPATNTPQTPAQTPPTTPPSPQNQTPPPPNKPSVSKLPIVIAGIFVLILILLGGYFVFNQVTKNDLENTPTPTTYEVPREIPE